MDNAKAVAWLLTYDSSTRPLGVRQQFVISDERYRGTVERLPIGSGLVVFLGTMDVLAPCTLEPSMTESVPWLSSNVAVSGRVTISLSGGARGEASPERAVMFCPVDNKAKLDHQPQRKLRLAGYRLRGDRIARLFNGDVPKPIAGLIDPKKDRSQLLEFRATSAMRALAENLFSERFNGALRNLYLEGVVLQLFALEVAEATGEGRPSLPRAQRAAIDEARERLLADMRDPPALADLAAAVGLNEKVLNAGFKQLYGHTVFEVLRNERLEHARIVLETTDTPLKDVALRVGYNQASNFSAAFAARYGMPPRRYATVQVRPPRAATKTPARKK